MFPLCHPPRGSSGGQGPSGLKRKWILCVKFLAQGSAPSEHSASESQGHAGRREPLCDLREAPRAQFLPVPRTPWPRENAHPSWTLMLIPANTSQSLLGARLPSKHYICSR